MNPKKNGFFIIEFMIYLTIFGIVSIFFMQAAMQVVGGLKKESRQIQKELMCLNALNAIRYELENADADKKQWHKLEKNCVLWHSPKDSKDYCITIQDNKLVYITGTYFPHQNVWGSKRTNIIIDDIQSLTFHYHYNASKQMLTLITNSITADVGLSSPFSAEQTICFNNRYL